MGKRPLLSEIATRARAYEWSDLWSFLPDPDPILEKAGLDASVFSQIMADGHVLACAQSRKAGVTNAEHMLQFPHGTKAGVIKYLERLMANLPIEEIIAQILDAPFYGFTMNEILWQTVDGKWYPAGISQKPNTWFVFDSENQPRFLSKNDAIQGESLPNYKFLLTTHYATYENPYGLRILSRCFWPVLFKKGGFKYWALFMEKFGIPYMLGKVPPGTTDEKRAELLTNLEKMVQAACAVVSDDESISVIEVKGRSEGKSNVFNAMIEVCNAEISKAILTQTLSTEIGNTGAYAASQSHLAVRQELCASDKKLVGKTFNELFRWCVQLNFGPMDVYPKLRFIEEDDAKEPHARRDDSLSSQGVRFSKTYYQRQYALRDDDIDKIEEPAKANAQTTQAKEDIRKEKRTDDHEDPKRKLKEGGESK